MLFYQGKWSPGKGKAFRSFNPMNNEIIWEGNFSNIPQLKSAINSAASSHLAWSKQTPQSRIKVIKIFYALLEKNKLAMTRLIATETGKTDVDASSEVAATLAKLNNSILAYKKRTGSQLNSMGAMQAKLKHESHGVLAVIGPFNFPLHLPNGHITPALIAGNTIIFKPSESTPMVAEYMMMLWAEAGLPKGVINMVHGGKDIVQALCKNPLSKGLLFTGSYKVGKQLSRIMAEYPEKILALELGGNNPLVVWSTRKINAAVDLIFESAFISSGQRCTCARRLILPNSKSGKMILTNLKKKVQSLSYANESDLYYGPLISPAATKGFLDYQAKLMQLGAKTILKARKVSNPFNLVTPSLMNTTGMRKAYDEENFGPMLQVQFVDTFEEAIEAANNTKYGLAAGLISDNKNLFNEFVDRINAGVINFNSTTTGASGAFPFGGIGRSGNLRPAGYYAADYCAWPKASIIKQL
ncbi:succinylglutamate-semialdehyde dehydrogenase [Gammaproteobacteria bacterium]|nr:succinylglutamate-semialdehyde dehydrogenase [Gammaproteobacteria bacterium]